MHSDESEDMAPDGRIMKQSIVLLMSWNMSWPNHTNPYYYKLNHSGITYKLTLGKILRFS